MDIKRDDKVDKREDNKADKRKDNKTGIRRDNKAWIRIKDDNRVGDLWQDNKRVTESVAGVYHIGIQ